MELAYYPGCSLKQTSALFDRQTKEVFSHLGFQLQEIEDWSCCGATSAGKIDYFLETAMPARNIGLAEAAGFSEMVIPCSACYSKTLLAQIRCQQDQKLKERINSELKHKISGSLKISSILEPLLRICQGQDFKDKIQRPLTAIKALCYYGCMLTRFPMDIDLEDNAENPSFMEIILNSLGALTKDWSHKTACCGASSAVYEPDLASLLMSRIMREAVARDVNCLVTTCPVCQMNLDVYQDRFCQQTGNQKRLPVYFLTELLGFALGIDIKTLQIDRHFTQATKLLEELELQQREAQT